MHAVLKYRAHYGTIIVSYSPVSIYRKMLCHWLISYRYELGGGLKIMPKLYTAKIKLDII